MNSRWLTTSTLLLLGAVLSPACGDDESTSSSDDAGTGVDASTIDASSTDREGIAMCEELGTTCHDSSSERGQECHELGHDLHVDECRASYDECIALCESEEHDGGQEHVDGGEMPVTLTFAARVGDEDFACGTTYTGQGTEDTDIIGADFRFYVSNIRLVGDEGEAPLTLEQDGKWQYEDVALLDFEDGSGPCESGNADMRSTVVGSAPIGEYDTLRFTLGIPFNLNHDDLADAEPPLNISGMFWVWQGGHKFLRIDLRVGNAGYNVHLGSTMCMSDGPMDPPVDECGRPNRVDVELTGFAPGTSVIVADLAALVADADLTANTDMTPPGCQSFPTDETDCLPVFPNLGLDFMTGEAGDTAQSFFSLE